MPHPHDKNLALRALRINNHKQLDIPPAERILPLSAVPGAQDKSAGPCARSGLHLTYGFMLSSLPLSWKEHVRNSKIVVQLAEKIIRVDGRLESLCLV